jgi:IMP dehydrogenase/GMP reductase
MATKKAAKKKAPEVKKGARQQSLPEMGDAKIKVLEDKALEYAEVRDARIGLSQKEGELKGKLLDLMKAQKREHYHRGAIKIDIVHEKENIKVKVKAGGDEDNEGGYSEE